MKKKTVIFIIIGIVLLFIILLGVNFYLSQKKKGAVTEEVTLTPEEQARLTLTKEEREKGITKEEKLKKLLEEKKKELEKKKEKGKIKVVQIKKIIDKKVKGATFSADKTKILYFDPGAKEFYSIGLDGLNDTAITRANLKNLYDVLWSATKDKAILVFSEDKGKTKKYIYFNFSDQKSTELDPRFQNIVLSPDGKRIAYLYIDKKKDISNLSIASYDGSNWRKITPYDKEEINLEWLSGGKLSILDYSTAYKEGKLSLYDIEKGGDYSVLLTKKYGLTINWSPDTKKVIYTDGGTKGARDLSLYVYNLNKKEEKNLQISTLADKCAWAKDSRTIICAIPENFSNYYVQPDDYYNEKFISRDSFYKIDVETGERTKIADADQFAKDYDVYKPFLSDDAKTMYFQRRHDGKLYTLVMP